MSEPTAAGADRGLAARSEVEQELPGAAAARAREVEVGAPRPLTGASPPDIEARLRELSSRVRGARAIGDPAASRCRPPTGSSSATSASTPTCERTPIEAAVLERMLRGGFPTGGLLERRRC